jgi:hypothetical protein
MKRSAKTARTKAVFVRKRRLSSNTINVPASIKHDEHAALPVSHGLETVVRKPLQAAKANKSRKLRRQLRNSEHKLVCLLRQRIKTSNPWGGAVIHPIAVLAWLASEEPFNSEFLLENAAIFIEGQPAEETDPILAEQIDRIIERFTESEITDAPSSQDNPLVEIPKDFSMVMTPAKAGGFEDHDAIMEDCDIRENKTNAMHKMVGSVETSKPTPYGFDPVQVLKKHAITFQKSDLPQTSNLTVDIHPLFREENFHGCPQHIYDVLRPALRLCTLLVTHRATSSFWHTAMFGTREPSFVPKIKRIRKDVPWTSSNAQIFNNYIAGLVDSLHFHFSLWPTPKHEGMYLYGSLHPIKDYQLGWLPKPGEPCRKSRICLHSDFYTTAKRLSLLRNPDSSMVLRFSLFLAVNIAHELAHFLEMSGHHYDMSDIFCSDNTVKEVEASKEPFLNDHHFNEVGSAFETKIFGGRVHPISCRIDCAYGLTTFDEPDSTNPSRTKTYYTIPMDWVAYVQQQETWDSVVEGWDDGDDESERVESKVFHIPRNGAKAVSVPYFDMTQWEDEAEQRAKKESGLGRKKRNVPLKIYA